MGGKVSCRFIGGLKGEEILTLPGLACQDKVAIVNNVWIGQGQDGKVTVMKGARPQHAPWISFTRDIYEKVKPVTPGCVTYEFVRTEDVHRCKKVLEEKGRLCRNEAVSNAEFCRVHQSKI